MTTAISSWSSPPGRPVPCAVEPTSTSRIVVSGSGGISGMGAHSRGSTGSLSKREDAEDALVHPVQRLARDEALERLDAEGELAEGERALVAEAAFAEADEVRLGGVFGAVDDAEVLAGPGT